MAAPTEAEVLSRLMQALRDASGCAHQLAHAQQSPNWLIIRDNLETMSKAVRALSLSRAMSRQAVLEKLTIRENSVRH